MYGPSKDFTIGSGIAVAPSITNDSTCEIFSFVPKAFPQFSISLSIICPKQLPKVKAIYNAGKRNNRAVDPPVDAKTTNFLVLISEGFREARGALSRFGANLPSNQSPSLASLQGAGAAAIILGSMQNSPHNSSGGF
ncbi:hypothetical protein KIW84_030024 [Lathyrus oleraceus]|uniref:Mediator of RNA polymerase II transcription subunit 25 n=1 Tax=Pisum sativum TaxID=3888 RepID=A0A9D4XMA8_PEA|nr:hypothetical protein KIW84_030024 [Pisum sativum]